MLAIGYTVANVGYVSTSFCELDLEIFVLENFHVLNFRVKIFSWCRIPMKIF